MLQKMLDTILPTTFDPAKYFLYLFIAVAGIFLIVGIFRLFLGKGSLVNCSISAAIAILCIYAIDILVFSFGTKLQFLFKPLPFVSISKEYLTIFPIMDASLQEICKEIVNLLVLAFMINLLEMWLPKGRTFLSWFGFRFLSMGISLCLYYCIDLFLNSVFPGSMMDVAPLILLGAVLVAFTLGFLKLIVGGALAFINPLLGIFYAFFFSKAVGKQLRRAMVTTLLLTALVYALNYFALTSVSIATVALMTYLPIILIGLIVWYIVGKFL